MESTLKSKSFGISRKSGFRPSLHSLHDADSDSHGAHESPTKSFFGKTVEPIVINDSQVGAPKFESKNDFELKSALKVSSNREFSDQSQIESNRTAKKLKKRLEVKKRLYPYFRAFSIPSPSKKQANIPKNFFYDRAPSLNLDCTPMAYNMGKAENSKRNEKFIREANPHFAPTKSNKLQE